MFPAGAFWRLEIKVGISQQSLQENVVYFTASAPLAIGIKGCAQMSLRPAIHENITWSGIKAGNSYIHILWKQGDVCYPADIDDHTVMVRRTKYLVMKCGHKWRAFASGRDIPAAEIRNSCDTGDFGNYIRVADLQTIGPC